MNATKTMPLLVLSLTVGCMNARELPETEADVTSYSDLEQQAAQDTEAPPMADDEYRPLVGQLPVENGYLDGEIGEVSGLERDSRYETSGWGEPSYASIYTIGRGENGAAMSVVEIEGGLNHAELQPGAHLEYDLYESNGNNSLYAYVVGCSGPEENNWEFDQVADETVLDVREHEEDANVLVIDYRATFIDWETSRQSMVAGSFEVTRQGY